MYIKLNPEVTQTLSNTWSTNGVLRPVKVCIDEVWGITREVNLEAPWWTLILPDFQPGTQSLVGLPRLGVRPSQSWWCPNGSGMWQCHQSLNELNTFQFTVHKCLWLFALFTLFLIVYIVWWWGFSNVAVEPLQWWLKLKMYGPGGHLMPKINEDLQTRYPPCDQRWRLDWHHIPLARHCQPGCNLWSANCNF